MHIPLVDLKSQYQSIKPKIDDAIQSVINETAFIRGKFVHEFETEFAKKYGVKHCIGVANGTDAIFITLKMLGIGAGDEVITTASSWISTSETISLTGAKPVFVDIEKDYYTIDPTKIEDKITPQTKAILPVHLYGQPADMTSIKKMCDQYDLYLVEDCAQAHFAEFQGKRVGTFGDAGTFSFYPGKNLGAYGDAGAVTTNDDALAEKIRRYANHGTLHKHDHEFEGVNSRLDGLQAAVLLVKLNYIDEWTQKRFKNAQIYSHLLKEIDGISPPKIRSHASHVFHLYVIQAEERDKLAAHLKANGIETGIHYPVALPFLKAYGYLGHKPSDFPVAYESQQKIISLPMYPELNEKMIEFIATMINQYYGED
ncbi:MAG: DegT/DnrJ/EryC1/StrS family aminotransferase [Methanoregula sp.]|nr:DegT/DnrJ/EryC1/StrS family aminotransferase [Methanoregula sp.]